MESVQLQTASTTQLSSKQTPSLLFLPPEIRILIYRDLLTRDSWINSERSIKDRERSHLLYPNILRTCRTIHKEASKVLFGENLFMFLCPPSGFFTDRHLALLSPLPRNVLNKMEQVEIQFRQPLRSYESATICSKFNEIATFGSPLKLLQLRFNFDPPDDPPLARNTEESLPVEVTEALCRVPVSQSIRIIVKADEDCEEEKLRAWMISVRNTKGWNLRGQKIMKPFEVGIGDSADETGTSSEMPPEWYKWKMVLEPPR